jgi:cytochrome b involved in lipid metabolism
MCGGNNNNNNPKASKEGTIMVLREERGKTMEVPLLPKYSTGREKELRGYTMEELEASGSTDQLLVAINGQVYDVTRYVDKHPGGDLVMKSMAGKDSTDAFENYHRASVTKHLLGAFHVGHVEGYSDFPVYPHVAEFREIRQELLRRGLYQVDNHFYHKLYLWLAFLFAAALYLSLTGTSMVVHMIGAVVLGVFWQQLAGLGHDLGHSNVSYVFQTDHWVGSVIGCFLGGISMAWWKKSHNVHHVMTNSIVRSPIYCCAQMLPLCF